MPTDAEPDLPTSVFLDLEPPPGGLEAVRARLRARQQRRVGLGMVALAALALLAVVPGLLRPPAAADPLDWRSDVAVAEAGGGMAVQARGSAAVEEVARSEDVLMVRIMASPRPER